MKIIELYNYLDSVIPASLSCEWDNDGNMLCPDGEKEVKKILFTLDVTVSAAKKAIDEGFDLIISHHPLIFKPLKGILDPMIIDLIRAGVAVFSFHTRLDAVVGGVNTILAQKCGGEIVQNGFFEGIGVIAEYKDSLSPSELAKNVKKSLDSSEVFLASAEKPCKRVAFLGGSGGDAISTAIENNCDAIVVGEAGYNATIDGARFGISVIKAGHFYTENPVLTYLEKTVLAVCDAKTIVFDCNLIQKI